MKASLWNIYRLPVQLSFLLFYNAGFFTFKYCPIPGLNCYACPLATFACPLGSLQHFMVLKRVPFFLLGFFLLLGSTVGRMICGWACPAGLIQDLFYKIPVKKVHVLFLPLRYVKYGLLLLLILLAPYFLKEPLFCKLCFVGTLQAGIPLALTDDGIRGLIGSWFYVKLAITGLLLSMFLFVKRPFCRFLCPLGAIYALFNRISYLQLDVGGGCTECNKCKRVCPVDIKVYEDPNSPECIRCLECTACTHVVLKRGRRTQIKEEAFKDV